MPGSDARPLPKRDLDHILEHTQGIWEDLRGGRVFVTGGTGFFGRWMLESFLRANEELDLGAAAVVLTRDPRRFAVRAPHIAVSRAITVQAGDVQSFEYAPGSFTHVLHMATETALGTSATASFDTAVDGTRRVLDFAASSGAGKLLLASSGAVYGRQPPDCERLGEEYGAAPSPTDATAAYGHGKRAAEYLCSAAAAGTGLEVKIARCFTFVGPLLPLDLNFAIGNFIRDAILGERIQVSGDGTTRRSYLYAADLAVWLWTILFRGESCRPYNVGSDADVSIGELARLVAHLVRPGIAVEFGALPVPGAVPARYVPSVERARIELGLRPVIELDYAIRLTAGWYQTGPPTSR